MNNKSLEKDTLKICTK